MPVALIIDDTCKARAAELGVQPDQYRMWEAGWRVPEVDEAIKSEALVKASSKMLSAPNQFVDGEGRVK